MSSELTRRVLFGVVAAPIAIGIVLVGGAPLAALLAIVSAIGAWELFRIARATGLTPLDNLGIALAGILPLLVHARYLRLYEPNTSISPLTLAALVVLALLAIAIWARGVAGRPLAAVATTVFGIAYTGGMLSYGYAIRYHDYAFGGATIGGWSVPTGGVLLLLPMLLTWASDIGAYAVGRTMGRHKLIPRVSPGKTVEGAIGGVVVTVLVCWAYVRFALVPHAQLALGPLDTLIFAIVISVAAQVGDLAESLIKREAGVKDSSHIIPGHGGVLDRFDSLLFVLPVAYLLLGVKLIPAPGSR